MALNLSTELAEHSNRLFVATLIISDSVIAYFHSDKIACFHLPTKAAAVGLSEFIKLSQTHASSYDIFKTYFTILYNVCTSTSIHLFLFLNEKVLKNVGNNCEIVLKGSWDFGLKFIIYNNEKTVSEIAKNEQHLVQFYKKKDFQSWWTWCPSFPHE